jgi:hypothetical protein
VRLHCLLQVLCLCDGLISIRIWNVLCSPGRGLQADNRYRPLPLPQRNIIHVRLLQSFPAVSFRTCFSHTHRQCSSSLETHSVVVCGLNTEPVLVSPSWLFITTFVRIAAQTEFMSFFTNEFTVIIQCFVSVWIATYHRGFLLRESNINYRCLKRKSLWGCCDVG